MKHKKTRWVLLTVLLFFLIPATFGTVFSAQSDEFYVEPQTAEKMLLDLAVIRPLGIVGTVLGSVAYVVSYPFAAWGGNTDETYQYLVADPAIYTFRRPLGHFEKDLAEEQDPLYKRGE